MAYFTYKNHQIFYEELGEGTPLLLLHGNTASSKMFYNIAQLYKKQYKVILIDFLGYGQSDHVEQLNSDLWYDQAMQVISFLEYKKYSKVNLIGTSGGAITAINVALERPEYIHKLIADSFEGEQADVKKTEALVKERENAMKDEGARGFFAYMNGPDWESVVNADTKAMVSHANTIVKFFHKSLSELKPDILLAGSKEDHS